MTSRDLGYDAPGQRFPPKFQPEPYAQDPVVIKHELEEKKKTIRSYLDLPPAQRLITLQKDIRDVQKDVRIYAQGFVETPYLHRALETLVAPATDAPGFDRPPKDDYNRDWRKLVRDLVAAHSPEPHLLGFGWEPSPEESECLRYMNLGDRRAGSTHWSCLREGKLVVRLRGAWNSIDHGWRLMVIDFKSGELEFIKKEYADLDTAELGIRHSTLNDLKAVVDTEADDAEPPSLDQRLMAATALSHSLPNIHEGKEKIFTGPASRSQGFSYTKHGLTFNPADRVQQKTDELGPLDVWKRSPEELEEMKKTLKKPKAAYEASPSDDKAIDIYNPPEYEPAEDISQNEFWRMYFSPQRMTEEFIETSKALDPRARRLLPTKPLSIETFYEMEDAIRLMPFHPDLFGGAFLPPFGIATLPGYSLSGPQRDLIFVAPPPPNVTIKYRIPEDLLSQLQAIKGLNFSLDQSFALQTRKLLKVMKPSHIRRLYLDVETTHPDGTVTKRVVGQRDLATADVEVDVRKITLSPRWLAACKSVFWPASMMAVATSVYTPYDGTHDLIHNLKPHETSPVTDVQEEIIHQTNETPARRLLHHLRHIPDLEEIDPVAARELELILSTPGVDIPLISLVEGEVSPFDLDQTHIDRQDPDSIRWRLYHPFT